MNVTTNIATLWRSGWRWLVTDKSGQDMIEYALLAAAVAVIVAAALPTAVVPVMSTLYSKISASLTSAS